MLHSINHDQQLYVLGEGHGYTGLGFAVAQRTIEGVAKWLGIEPPREALGTPAHYEAYRKLLDAAARTGRRCDIDLHPQLLGLEGKRVEVVDADGLTRRFYVGKSTGWLPVHLEVKTRRSMGGVPVDSRPYKSVRVVGTR